MCPIRITPKIPIFISEIDMTQDSRGHETNEPLEVRGILFILPEGKPADHQVKVYGFPRSPGGILESERLTTGYTKDEFTLTTPEDTELSQELGASIICVDQVIYEAINP
jgi:hypothetical protein